MKAPAWWSRRAGDDEDDERPVRPSAAAWGVLGAAVVVYVWSFTRWTTHLHDAYGTFGFDFGIYDQGLWLLSRFKRPFITFMGRHLFGDHTSFILLLLVPLYWIVPSAHVLLFVQALVLGVAAIPLFLLARHVLRDELLAAGLSVAFLLNPALGWLNMEQFHPDVFEVPLLLVALWCMATRRWVGFLVAVACTLLVKEDVVLTTFTLGLVVAMRWDRRVGLITSAMSLVAAGVALWWVLPALNGVGSLNGWRVPFGGPSGFARTTFAHPAKVVRYLRQDNRPWYTWQVVAPTALVALAAPSIAIVAAGPLAANVVSNFYYQHRLAYHYTAPIIPVLAAATVFGIAHLRPRLARGAVVGVVLAASLGAAYQWGPAPWSRHPAPLGDTRSPLFPFVREASAMIPADAAVSSYYPWGTHLDHRARIYDFPVPWRAQNWGTFHQEGQRLPEADTVDYVIVPDQLAAREQAVLAEQVMPAFDVVFHRGGVLLLHRRGA